LPTGLGLGAALVLAVLILVAPWRRKGARRGANQR
jgi:D-alanyl-D-alanine carboxypeptidase (penicillin-binding protein 5/6)